MLNKKNWKRSKFVTFSYTWLFSKIYKSIFKSTLEGSKEDFFVPRSAFQDNFSGSCEGLKFFRSYFDCGKIANTRSTSSLSCLINSLKFHSFYKMLWNPKLLIHFNRYSGCLCESAYHPLVIKTPETKVIQEVI